MIKIIDSFFENQVKLLNIEKFYDGRGYFVENYNKKSLSLFGINDNFVQDNESYSKIKFTIRGLHFQIPPYDQSKLITVKQGSILDIVLDIRLKSNTYGRVETIELDANDDKSLYISSGFAHGFCTLSDNTIVNYKTSNFYSPDHESTICFNDKNLNINFENNENDFIISDKDLKCTSFKNFQSPF